MNLEVERYEGELRELRRAARKVLEALDCEPKSFVSWVDSLKEAREALRQVLAKSEEVLR